MTKEEQIQKAKEYNLGATSREEYKSKIINSINSKFELGPYDYWSEEGKKRKEKMLKEWAVARKNSLLANGTNTDEAHKEAIRHALRMFKSFQGRISITNPLMIWTIDESNIQQLVSDCVNQGNSECNSDIVPYFFDAKAGTAQEFNQIISNVNTGGRNVVVVLNYTYAQGDLWRLLYAYLKDNSRDKFFMIASSPLEPEDGVKTNWDRGLTGMVLQSVLLSE